MVALLGKNTGRARDEDIRRRSLLRMLDQLEDSESNVLFSCLSQWWFIRICVHILVFPSPFACSRVTYTPLRKLTATHFLMSPIAIFTFQSRFSRTKLHSDVSHSDPNSGRRVNLR